MQDAKLYIRRDGSFGSSCDGCQDTGHYIVEDSGQFTVFSVKDGYQDVAILENGTREQAETAITKDWREA